MMLSDDYLPKLSTDLVVVEKNSLSSKNVGNANDVLV